MFDHKLPSPSPYAFSVLRAILVDHQLVGGGGLRAQRVLDIYTHIPNLFAF